MWSARSGVTRPAMPGGGPPRTNDIDLDERRKTLTGREGVEEAPRTHGLAIGFSNPGK